MGYIMSKCIRCKIDILDDAMMCPLCRGVLQKEQDVKPAGSVSDEPGSGKKNRYHSLSVSYPDIYPAIRKMQFVKKLSVFVAVLAECILLLINYLTYNGVKWSLVTGVGLAYACFTLLYSFKQNKSVQRKLLVQLVLAFAAFVLIDATIGYKGWSITLAIPTAVMVVELTVIVLMIVNNKNWQNYILTSIALFLISIVMVVLALFDIIDFNLLSIIAAAATGLLVLGTLVFGDKRAENELRRRFHV